MSVNLSKGLQQNNATMLVLVVLADGVRYGYDIAREVDRRSANVIAFKHGTLYPILHSLEKENMIVSSWEHPTGERPRRTYRITPTGLKHLELCRNQWDEFSHAINKVLGERPSEQPV